MGDSNLKKLADFVLFAWFLLLIGGCSSGLTRISAGPSDGYQKLGQVEGKSCGALGVAGTAYYFIPLGLNGRYERAYHEAVAKAPGATGLIDVTLSEDWFWFAIATARCVTVSGEAIK